MLDTTGVKFLKMFCYPWPHSYDYSDIIELHTPQLQAQLLSSQFSGELPSCESVVLDHDQSFQPLHQGDQLENASLLSSKYEIPNSFASR